MKIGICGHFGGKEVFLDGQTVKTKMVYDALSAHFGQDNLKKVDTYKIKKRLIPVLFGTVGIFLSCRVCVMLPAQNGIKIFAPLFSFLKRVFRKRIYYAVIGGWLPSLIEGKDKLVSSLLRFDGIFVETETMKSALESMGFENVTVLPNFKRLNMIDNSAVEREVVAPYKLCTFSRVSREKGIETAVSAVTAANKAIGSDAFSLDIYGQVDGGYAEAFESLKSRFPEYIRYGGMVPFEKSTEVLADYSCLLFPTFYNGEGFAGTLIDAFASALPVIASDWKYNPEIVDDEVGIIFKAGDEQDLCRVLLEVYNGKYDMSAMRRSCYDRAHHYSFERAVRILAENIEV